ncbi:hypothetical protein L596_017810 [Steinernema carpocapsae]|uniref:Uncharacterized protein n=1 Tax=Steinernema carpocapsae TaxID=34508 RepID=A0A4U5N365_STECR|nr:hypothetical protein L596_017810 [Steinernema carpocapsae]
MGRIGFSEGRLAETSCKSSTAVRDDFSGTLQRHRLQPRFGALSPLQEARRKIDSGHVRLRVLLFGAPAFRDAVLFAPLDPPPLPLPTTRPSPILGLKRGEENGFGSLLSNVALLGQRTKNSHQF